MNTQTTQTHKRIRTNQIILVSSSNNDKFDALKDDFLIKQRNRRIEALRKQKFNQAGNKIMNWIERRENNLTIV